MGVQTPYLALTKPTIGGPDTDNRWGLDLNSNFDILDSWAAQQGSGGTVPAHTHPVSDIIGLGNAATQNYTISSAEPSGGIDGDVWYQVPA